MSRKYKFHYSDGVYFVSFATVNWMDVFVRDVYCQTLVNSLDYCRKNKGMQIYCWCIMPSHVHLIFRSVDGTPGKLLGEFKVHTSKVLQKQIAENIQESRKEWLLWMMKRAGSKNSNVKAAQFLQQHNQPIELWSNEVIDQKINYIHQNPVEAGFVLQPEHWKYSSAANYADEMSVLEIDIA